MFASLPQRIVTCRRPSPTEHSARISSIDSTCFLSKCLRYENGGEAFPARGSASLGATRGKQARSSGRAASGHPNAEAPSRARGQVAERKTGREGARAWPEAKK